MLPNLKEVVADWVERQIFVLTHRDEPLALLFIERLAWSLFHVTSFLHDKPRGFSVQLSVYIGGPGGS